MNFEVDRYSSAWAHIALCADLTWATEPPDDFIIANQVSDPVENNDKLLQRLWAQHCRVSQVLQDTAVESSQVLPHNQCELTESHTTPSPEKGNSSRRSVKDVIPESRLAQYYGNFYYDEVRENCYKFTNDKISGRGYSGQGCENSDLTECWMLPEVEYWFRKLMDDPADRIMLPRRRRQYRMPIEDDLYVKINGHRSAASERWGSSGAAAAAGEEATLEARIRSVRALWDTTGLGRQPPRAPSPPPPSRKMRARRRQPRRLAGFSPAPPSYCLDAPAQLCCDPACKFQFDTPRPPHMTECQRALGRLSASVQAIMRANAARCPMYRGTNVSRYVPTGQRPLRCPDRRYGIWWPRDHPSRVENRLQLPQSLNVPDTTNSNSKTVKINSDNAEKEETKDSNEKTSPRQQVKESPSTTDNAVEKLENVKAKEKIVNDGQTPSTSAAALDSGLRKKRLYSTVLSMSAPSPITITPSGCVRLSQKLVTPGLIKLNPKVVLPTRIRPPNVEVKFEELEKEALEQYKASDESIDTKFRELEKQAVEQYSTSNSNTSCSSGNSTEKRTPSNPTIPETTQKSRKQMSKFLKEASVDSVVIYSQNFPDLNTKSHTNTSINLKNFHNPPRGEKKESYRSNKNSRSFKGDWQRAASDTDYEAKPSHKGSHKGPLRWTLHVMPPKKRHLTVCASDFSSDEDMEEANGSIKDAGPCIKNRVTGKVKMSAHGGGDLNPIMRKA
ncbi:hypothetical protein RR46_07660 [Papilio xuthus]|uniref:Uncharacterized protein n=1 Tax=Papilio xuthus TaxID=66420 RepID=A0A194QBK7_PAPXU|nr:hypothetical protein RR46_07660 [Papilio xuthus]